LVIACGTAAPAEPTGATQSTAPPAVQDTSTPTSPPEAVTAPRGVEVHPGRVTLLVDNFGNERFDPVYGTIGIDYARHLHSHLFSADVDDHGKMIIIPGIATSWELSSDRLTWTYTIREGVKFHDGTDLTVEDVLWSLQHFMGPQAKDYARGSVAIRYSGIVDRIEQTGPNQVSVTTTVPAAELPGYTFKGGGGQSGSIVFPRRESLHDDGEATAYDRNPIGAGIMKFVAHSPAVSMTFERFDDHYHQPRYGFPNDKRLNFTELHMLLVPEESTRVAALRSGEADMGRVSLGTRQQVEAGGGRIVFSEEARAFQIFIWGCGRPDLPCHDRRVRQALNFAIDKEVIRNQLYGSEVMDARGWAWVTPNTVGYSPELDPYPFDPDRARQLLADSGYPGGQGFGRLIVVTRDSPAIPFVAESALIGSDFWRRELGLDVEVRVIDSTIMSRDTANTPEIFDGQVVWSDNDGRYDATGVVGLYYAPYGGLPEARIRHTQPEAFALAEEANAALGQPQEHQLLNNVYRQLREEAHVISIGYINTPWGLGPRIANWEPWPVADYVSALDTITLK
jgi:peptide/nickel transport system substrate-binding protein